MAKPLNELKGKKEWTWNKEHDKAFRELKKNNKSTSTISPKERRKFRVETDASEHAIEEVLS